MFSQATRKIAPYALTFTAALYLYLQADSFAYFARRGILGPDFWPKILLVLTMAACFYEIIKRIFSKKYILQNQTAPLHPEAVLNKCKMHTGILLWVLAITVAYACLLTTLGFPLCTFLYFILFMIATRYRNAWAILANSLIGTLILAVIFMKAVHVSLPLGREPYSEITFFILGVLGVR
ncbi:MAG: tripartite tricarboxylate transporter TctB family protein [Acidobacteria bacterium]|nr:tripartite tricarboxylate transporter TctB family protein [Acidobacteriota bacterium]